MFTRWEKQVNVMGVLIISLSIPLAVLGTFPSTRTTCNRSLLVLPVGLCISSLMSLWFYIYYDSVCLEESSVHLAMSFLLPFQISSSPDPCTQLYLATSFVFGKKLSLNVTNPESLPQLHHLLLQITGLKDTDGNSRKSDFQITAWKKKHLALCRKLASQVTTAQDVVQLHRLWAAFVTQMQADFPPLLLSPFHSRPSSLSSLSGKSPLGVLITSG